MHAWLGRRFKGYGRGRAAGPYGGSGGPDAMAGFFGPLTKRDMYEANYAATKGPVQGAGLRFLRGGSDC